MTTITFYKAGGIYYGFEEQGHTGYGESGDDVLCAALSSMTMLIINAIEVSFASDVDYTIDEKTTDIRVICKGALLFQRIFGPKEVKLTGKKVDRQNLLKSLIGRNNQNQ